MNSTNETLSEAASQQPTYIGRILPSVIAMLILFILSALGNVTVFATLVSSGNRKTRISIIILHLTVADLFVTFILIPSEVVWRLCRFWLAGNAACKLFSFLRAFGFYLSSMVLIVVSLDRYIAIIYPLRANSEFARRGHFMLLAAWIISGLCSLPQMFIWNTQSAPDSPEQEQCVTFGSDPRAITAFTVFFLVTVYFIPLIIMVFTYSRILHTIVKQSDFRQASSHGRNEGNAAMMDSCSEPAATNNTVVVMNRINNNNNTSETDTESGPVQHSQLGVFARRLSYAVLNSRFGSRRSLSTLRTHNNNNSLIDHHIGRQQPQQQQQQQRDYRSSHFNRARARTLRMTVIIVLAFILCWTPNVVMSVWFLADPSGAQKAIDPRIADVLFILTITNSVVNPYIYGSYASEMRSKFLKWFNRGGRRRNQGAMTTNGARGNAVGRLMLGGEEGLRSQSGELLSGNDLLGMSEGRGGISVRFRPALRVGRIRAANNLACSEALPVAHGGVGSNEIQVEIVGGPLNNGGGGGGKRGRLFRSKDSISFKRLRLFHHHQNNNKVIRIDHHDSAGSLLQQSHQQQQHQQQQQQQQRHQRRYRSHSLTVRSCSLEENCDNCNIDSLVLQVRTSFSSSSYPLNSFSTSNCAGPRMVKARSRHYLSRWTRNKRCRTMSELRIQL